MRHRAGETERAPSRRLRVGVGAATVLLIGAFVIAALVSGMTGGRTVPLTAASAPSASSTSAASSPGLPQQAGDELYVHVSGAVNRPGLIRVAGGSRVVDAIEAAGGFAEAADQGGVNLARLVQDGEQLRVPVVGEVPPIADGSSGAVGGGAAGGLVDLNRATSAQLETLPRIGPALAQRIIEWREANGRFSAVTDLRNVAGVGEKIFEGLKDRVVV
jgi:competence protein ComEA